MSLNIITGADHLRILLLSQVFKQLLGLVSTADPRSLKFSQKVGNFSCLTLSSPESKSAEIFKDFNSIA